MELVSGYALNEFHARTAMATKDGALALVKNMVTFYYEATGAGILIVAGQIAHHRKRCHLTAIQARIPLDDSNQLVPHSLVSQRIMPGGAATEAYR